MVMLLTSYSQCDVNAMNQAGQTAAILARSVGQNDIADYLTSQSSVASVTSTMAESDITVRDDKRIRSAQMDGPRIVSSTMEDGSYFHAKVFIDATYEGDLMATAGVSYTTTREGNAKYKNSGLPDLATLSRSGSMSRMLPIFFS